MNIYQMQDPDSTWEMRSTDVYLVSDVDKEMAELKEVIMTLAFFHDGTEEYRLAVEYANKLEKKNE